MPLHTTTQSGVLSLSNVGKTYAPTAGRTTTALKAIDLQVASGEIVALVGESGCGKSTLLRIIAGLEPHDEGQVAIGGSAVSGPGRDRGVVFQDHRLLPWLTVAENVGFGLDQLDAGARSLVVSEQIALVGLRGFEQAYPHQLSGGMAQRASLARALAPAPRVLLLDEPFAALDAFTKIQLQEELLRIHSARGTTLIVVTHDIEEAVFLSDRIVVLSQRPGTIRRVFDVELRRPRERTDAEFSSLRRAVFEELFRTSPLDVPRPVAEARSVSRLTELFTSKLVPGENS